MISLKVTLINNIDTANIAVNTLSDTKTDVIFNVSSTRPHMAFASNKLSDSTVISIKTFICVS